MALYDVKAVQESWREASEDLGVRVVAENCALVDADGRRHELILLIPDFGNKRGMAVLPSWDETLAATATDQGYGYTVLSRSYEKYDRALFEATLNDWQWTAEGDPPPWYTGQPWS